MQDLPINKTNITEDDLHFDRAHIWHPYTAISQNAAKQPPLFPVASASGVRIQLTDGRELIDGMSSWWSAIHGYNHPALNAAAHEQIDQMSHVMFGGLTNKPAIELCRRLVALTPTPLQTVFLADSGSVSVEIAIKMAVQYWRCRGNEQRQKLLTIKHGYHGDTIGAMSVCDPVNGMHSLFRGLLLEQVFIEAPSAWHANAQKLGYPEAKAEQQEEQLAKDIRQFESALAEHHQELVGVILEPIVQGAGGMRFYCPDYLRRVSELCREYDVLLILDEIATGFGRTGKMFACEHAGIVPDIMTVGKALTGGYMTLAAVICTEQVSRTISEHSVLMHGPTFMGNPLACRVACASLDLLATGAWQQQIAQLEQGLIEGLAPCRTLPAVADVRVLGGIGVVELKQPVVMAEIQPRLVAEGIWVRPFGKLVYVMPPYIISQEDLAALCAGICRVVGEMSFH